MKLVITWWNCRLSPPFAQAKKFPTTKDFDNVITSLLQDRDTDILALCEVDPSNIKHIETLIKKSGIPHYTVLNLYKPGKSIDDFCLIYNSLKLRHTPPTINANIRDDYNNWLKAGVFVGFDMVDQGPLVIGLSHWQSRGNIPEKSPIRMKLGSALKAKIKSIQGSVPECPIILCGDYNDEPFDDSVVHGIGATRDATIPLKRANVLFNPFWPLMGSHDCSTLPVGSYLGSKGVSSMLMFDHMMMCSVTLRSWTMANRAILNETPAGEWIKVSDHYPVTLTLHRKTQ